MRRHRAILGVVLVAVVLIVAMIIWLKVKSPLLVGDGVVDSMTFQRKFQGAQNCQMGNLFL